MHAHETFGDRCRDRVGQSRVYGPAAPPEGSADRILHPVLNGRERATRVRDRSRSSVKPYSCSIGSGHVAPDRHNRSADAPSRLGTDTADPESPHRIRPRGLFRHRRTTAAPTPAAPAAGRSRASRPPATGHSGPTNTDERDRGRSSSGAVDPAADRKPRPPGPSRAAPASRTGPPHPAGYRTRATHADAPTRRRPDDPRAARLPPRSPGRPTVRHVADAPDRRIARFRRSQPKWGGAAHGLRNVCIVCLTTARGGAAR